MNKGIHTRGYLPHWDFEKSTQAVTFRLADSVPAEALRGWNREIISILDITTREKELHKLIAKYEDGGHGGSVLKIPECAAIIQGKLIEGHPTLYRLIDWCVMPNHVHVLIKLAEKQSLHEIVRLWKGGSSIEINRLLDRTGPLWQREYYDRLVRDMDHLYSCIVYIRNNPVKANYAISRKNGPFPPPERTGKRSAGFSRRV